MKTYQKPGFIKVEQTNNNITSWVGLHPGNRHPVITGQTFIATTEGDLEAIEVFSNIVTDHGNVVMTMHQFDPQQKKWGPELGSATVEFNAQSLGKWVPFSLPGIHLHKGSSYGFKLASNETLIGVGEAVGSHQTPPFINGQEWQFNQDKAESFSYFSLAFKVDLKAA